MCASSLDDEPVAHADDAVADGADLGVVRDEHDGLTALLVEAAQERQHVGRHRRVEVSGRLVGKDQGRLVHQAARDRDALLLAAGELHRPMVRALGQADPSERLARQLVRLAALHPGVLTGERDVLERGQRRDQVERLEHEAHRRGPKARPLAVGQVGD